MEKKSIDVKILESNQDFIEVKLPFLDIPVRMDYHFFNTRLESGYFKIQNLEKKLPIRYNNLPIAQHAMS